MSFLVIIIKILKAVYVFMYRTKMILGKKIFYVYQSINVLRPQQYTKINIK